MDPADTYLSSLPFTWDDFGVTKEDVLNEEPTFLKFLTFSWRTNHEFAHMLA